MSFCVKCGAQLSEGMKFCERCGTKVENITPNVQTQQPGFQPQTAPENMQGQAAPGSSQPLTTPGGMAKPKAGLSKKAKIWIGAGAGAAALMVIVLVLVFVLTRSRTINLNDYITINCTGYDSMGYASYEFDTDAFLEDYGDKIKIKKQSKSGIDWLDDLYDDIGNPASMLVWECVGGYLDQTSNLSNGDVITFTWSCSDETAQEVFGCKLKYEDIEYTVSGLDEVASFDPFEDIELIYSGIAPNGSVYVQNNSTDPAAGSLYYSVTPSDGLSNGMTIEVSIGEGDWSYMVENYGKVPSATSKEYTVDGLGSYVMQLSELSEDMLDKLAAQSEDVISAYVARDWEDSVSLDGLTYLGSYLLTPKDTSSYYYGTQLYMVYKLQVHEYEPNEGLDDTFAYYYYVEFEDVMLLPDGTCSVNLSDYRTCSNRFNRVVQWKSFWGGTKTLYYYGYEDLDSLFNKVVTTQIDSYSYDSSVEDVQ